jgi:hypothetical protein
VPIGGVDLRDACPHDPGEIEELHAAGENVRAYYWAHRDEVLARAKARRQA